MTVTHQNWNAEQLYEALRPRLPGISIEVLARAESTNSALLDRIRCEARNGEQQTYGRRAHDMQPCLLVAEHQTHGRGRMGRAWLSAPNSSLTFSLALNLAPADWSGLSLAVGCAIAEALEPNLATLASPRLKLKWPNDIWLDERKLGGILIETVSAGSGRMVIIGVGLNIKELGVAKDGDDSTQQFNTGFAALNELLPDCSAPAALALIAPALVNCLLDFEQSGFAAWMPRYTRRDLTLGRCVSAGDVTGISNGVSEQGELLLQTLQGTVTISGGEVSVRLAPTSVQQEEDES